jgi:hypothetical protein
MTKRLALLALLAGVLVAVPGPHDTARAAFAGKNGRIAFVRAAGAGPLEEVFMVSPASGLTANLSNDPATSDTAPAWSPDGTRVAFQRSGLTDGIWTMDATGGGDAELWMVRADGSDLTSSPTTATRTGRPAGPRTAPASPSPARARAARPASCCWTWAPAARSPLPRPAASTPPPTGRPTASGSPSPVPARRGQPHLHRRPQRQGPHPAHLRRPQRRPPVLVAGRHPDRLRPRRRPGRRPALPPPHRHPGQRQDHPGDQRPGRGPAAELAAAVVDLLPAVQGEDSCRTA